MLQFQLSKHHGGFILWGDYGTLRPLHSLILDLTDKCPVLTEDGFVLGLAYDIRKAYESMREKKSEVVWDDEITVYGVEQVWPTFIAQVAMLRRAMAFVPTSRNQQSLVYGLEAFLEAAVEAFYPAGAGEIMRQYESLSAVDESLLDQLLGSRTAHFLGQPSSWRKKALAQVLFSLQPMYSVFHDIDPGECPNTVIDPAVFEGLSWDTLDEIDVKF